MSENLRNELDAVKQELAMLKANLTTLFGGTHLHFEWRKITGADIPTPVAAVPQPVEQSPVDPVLHDMNRALAAMKRTDDLRRR